MKKRKSPVVLVTVLILAVGGLAMVQNFNPESIRSLFAGKAPDQATGKSRESASRDEVRGAMNSKRGGPEGSEGEEDVAMVEPSILEPEETAFKPTPNATSTSAHWYNENANKKRPEGG